MWNRYHFLKVIPLNAGSIQYIATYYALLTLSQASPGASSYCSRPYIRWVCVHVRWGKKTLRNERMDKAILGVGWSKSSNVIGYILEVSICSCAAQVWKVIKFRVNDFNNMQISNYSQQDQQRVIINMTDQLLMNKDFWKTG